MAVVVDVAAAAVVAVVVDGDVAATDMSLPTQC